MLEEATTNSVQVIEMLYVLLTVCYDKFPCTWSSLEDEGKWNSWIQCVTQSQTFFNYTSAGIFNSYWVPLWTKFISSTSLFIENDPPTVCQLTTHLKISEADVRLLNRILKKMKSITQNILPFFMIKSWLPILFSHLSPVQGYWQEHEKVWFSFSCKQEPPLRQKANWQPWKQKWTT